MSGNFARSFGSGIYQTRFFFRSRESADGGAGEKRLSRRECSAR